MAQTFSTELAGIDSTPVVKANAAKAYGARIRRFRATVAMAAQADTDTIVLADIPAGYTFAFGLITASATLGASATISIGTAASAAKYRAAATHTTANTPVLFGTQATVGLASPLTAVERVIATVGTAALPGSGTFCVDLYFTAP